MCCNRDLQGTGQTGEQRPEGKVGASFRQNQTGNGKGKGPEVGVTQNVCGNPGVPVWL